MSERCRLGLEHCVFSRSGFRRFLLPVWPGEGKRRVESGLPLGRQFGYRLVRINGRSIVELDPIQAPKVKRIFELFAYQPLTLESLIDTLECQGIIYTDRQPKWTKSKPTESPKMGFLQSRTPRC